MDLAIRVSDLGKLYHIGTEQKRYDRFGEQITDVLINPVRKAGKMLRGQASGVAGLNETIWALSKVSFDVQPGEAVAVIGRNGAGKSTLLKILSRITEPTEGFVDIFGRVGSLLEVGTGFHPELTGRENIFLNGAILGMKRGEIERKFDEIVAFADIDRFLDTPVKHYSSGMYVRLAFSVAAHLEPEILLVDEVLAVGDAAFQRKCLGKMDDVTKQGRTVLFVSHNMALVQSLCQRGILLQKGEITHDGPVGDVVNAYLQQLEQAETQDLSERTDRYGKGQVRLTRLEITDGGDPPSLVLKTGGTARFVFQVSQVVPGMNAVFTILDELGHPVSSFKSDLPAPDDVKDPTIGAQIICEIDELMLMAGRYRVNALIGGRNEWQDFIEAAAYFDVEAGQLRGRPMPPQARKRASAAMPHRWTLPN
jgi:lipopolysaccharide transport system ATP-binding protein